MISWGVKEEYGILGLHIRWKIAMSSLLVGGEHEKVLLRLNVFEPPMCRSQLDSGRCGSGALRSQSWQYSPQMSHPKLRAN